MQKPKNDSGPGNSPVLNFGWTMVGGFLFCFFAGFYADQHWGTGYSWTLMGVGAGTAWIVYELWKILRSR